MIPALRIVPLTVLPEGFATLRAESQREGFHMLARMGAEWEAGTNRFALEGECLLGAFREKALVGCGGLNRDPYRLDRETGRLRRIYVAPAARRQGVASALLEALEAAARGHFTCLRLRTETEEAGFFYLRHGYRPVADETATHEKWFVSSSAGRNGRRDTPCASG